MFFGIIGMLILYVLLKYILAWIRYFNSQDQRLGQSTWRWSYDYEVDGERDISDLDDKNFVRLRRKRNKIITLMYSVVLIMFILSMYLLSQILIFFGKWNLLDEGYVDITLIKNKITITSSLSELHGITYL